MLKSLSQHGDKGPPKTRSQSHIEAEAVNSHTEVRLSGLLTCPLDGKVCQRACWKKRRPHAQTYSCFDKGCPTKALKRTRQCRLVLWVERVWRRLIEVHSVFQQEKRRHK